jgi:hypothetical protein
MKKVAFFFEPDWAFGSVHYELFKYLWNEDYNCHLLAWNKAYTVDELQELDKHVKSKVVHEAIRIVTGQCNNEYDGSYE